MDNEDISKKKLTLQGLSKVKLRLGLGSLSGASSGTTIVTKRRKKLSESEFPLPDHGSLTAREQITRINALQSATFLRERSDKLIKSTQKEGIQGESKVDDKESKVPDVIVEDKDNEKVTGSICVNKTKRDEVKSETVKKRSVKLSKDAYSKHSKLVIEQAIGDVDKTDYSIFRQRANVKNKKSKFKGANILREVIVTDELTIRELSARMAENSKDVLRVLKEEVGENYSIDGLIDPDIACEIVKKFKHTVKRINNADKEKGLFTIESRENLAVKFKPPIVTFMGHVDHGKTSLLDAFRESDIAEKESGGITQHIGAYQIVTKNQKKITFIDTPGHEAFTAMRVCGASITNIVVIVVAADDGIMPQTVEAINHAKAANVSIIVALNKIDKSKPGDVEKIISSLPQYNIIPEELGGDVMVVPVSAKKKINLDKLEEAILLIAELMDLQAIEDCRALGLVIESEKDKAKGISATLIVEEGTLNVGDMLVVGTTYGKVRSMVNHVGQREKIALPSTPVKITGLSDVPNAGEKFVVVKHEEQAREIIKYRLELADKAKAADDLRCNLDIFGSDDRGIEELSIVLKCDVTGSVDAILSSIGKLGKDQIKLNVLHKAVGGITDSDILLAEASSAVVLAFNVKVDSKMKDLAKQKKVEICTYNIIYELIDDVRARLTKMLKPVTREVHIGSASVRQIFNVSKAASIMGCHVSSGVIKRDSFIKVVRNKSIVYEGRVKALRRFKDDVKEVGANFECGISLESNSDVKVGDILEAYQSVQEERVL